MPDPTTIRRAAAAVDTSAERLTRLATELRDYLGHPRGRGRDALDELVTALAARQREAVREALMWGDHDRECARRRIVPATGKPGPCTCGFDQALDRLAPKEGW